MNKDYKLLFHFTTKPISSNITKKHVLVWANMNTNGVVFSDVRKFTTAVDSLFISNNSLDKFEKKIGHIGYGDIKDLNKHEDSVVYLNDEYLDKASFYLQNKNSFKELANVVAELANEISTNFGQNVTWNGTIHIEVDEENVVING